MEEPVIPGARVRAATKHGPLSVDEIASAQPGMARLMDELSRRYWTLFYAAKAENWDLAAYMARESENLLATMALVRPKYKEDLEAFVRGDLARIAEAIEGRNWPAFQAAYHDAIRTSDVYHDKYNKRFIRFRLPDHPPDWFDLAPR